MTVSLAMAVGSTALLLVSTVDLSVLGQGYYKQPTLSFPNAMCMAPQNSNDIWRAGAVVVLLLVGRALGGWLHAKRQTLLARRAREQQAPTLDFPSHLLPGNIQKPLRLHDGTDNSPRLQREFCVELCINLSPVV